MNRDLAIDYLILSLVFLGAIVVLSLAWNTYVKYPDADIEVSYFNGLLTASSILLGFSTWVVGKNTSRFKLVLLAISLIILFYAVTTIVSVAVGESSKSWGLLWLEVSFIINTLVATLSTAEKIGLMDDSKDEGEFPETEEESVASS